MKDTPKFKDKFMAIAYYVGKGEEPPKEVLNQFDEFEGLVPLYEIKAEKADK